MIPRSTDGKYRVLSLSYGKDSLACLWALESLQKPLDAIFHAEVWATDDISADLPPMVEFKKKADAIIKERYGIEVQHICAMCDYKHKHIKPKDGIDDGVKRYKWTYEDIFYTVVKPRQKTIKMTGGGTERHTDSQPDRATGVQRSSRDKFSILWVPNSKRQLVYKTQDGSLRYPRIYGFPITITPKCKDLKLQALKFFQMTASTRR